MIGRAFSSAAGMVLALVGPSSGCRQAAVAGGEQNPVSSRSGRPATPAAAPVSASASSEVGRPAPGGPTRIRIQGVELELEGCVLKYSSPEASGRFDFSFPPPCQFVVDTRGAVQSVSTPHGSVVLVRSSRPLAPGGGGRDCDTRLRGVVVEGNQLFLSEDTQRVASCATGPWDLVMFHVFASRRVPLGRASDGGSQ